MIVPLPQVATWVARSHLRSTPFRSRLFISDRVHDAFAPTSLSAVVI
jgi:hypothetical protein